MIQERILATIQDLENLIHDSEMAIHELRKVVAGLSQGAKVKVSAPANGHKKQTYADTCLRILKDAGRPMHITDILSELHKERGLPDGSISRPAVQTGLARFMKKAREIKKAGAAKYKYVGIN